MTIINLNCCPVPTQKPLSSTTPTPTLTVTTTPTPTLTVTTTPTITPTVTLSSTATPTPTVTPPRILPPPINPIGLSVRNGGVYINIIDSITSPCDESYFSIDIWVYNSSFYDGNVIPITGKQLAGSVRLSPNPSQNVFYNNCLIYDGLYDWLSGNDQILPAIDDERFNYYGNNVLHYLFISFKEPSQFSYTMHRLVGSYLPADYIV